MTEVVQAWFDPAAYAWIPGTCLGLLGGLEGTLAGILAPPGKARPLVLGIHLAGLVACVGLLITGIIAKAEHQPYGVWYGLGFPGLLGVVIYGGLTPVLLRQYRCAEMRRSLGQDL